MKPKELLEILSVAEKLKCNTRHCYTSSGRRESVAEHSWRISLMAMLLTKEFPEADMDKVIRMCLIHDMGEAFTGDIPTFEKTNADTRKEDDILLNWGEHPPGGRPGGMGGAAHRDERHGDTGSENLQGAGQNGSGDPAQ